MSDASPPVSVPRISTQRLLLRELRPGDFDAYAASMADPVAREHLPGLLDRRTAWRMFAAAAGNWLIHGIGWWIVEVRATSEAVGVVGAFYRETGPELELGWSIYRPFWRQGFASEAAQAALEYALAQQRRRRAIAHISVANAASVGVGARLGMRYERDVELYGDTVGLYAVER